ncbi:hypothetical protein GH714_029123 [Hevea brasiliensis]|uniref:Uncharacterized protein n=1 Tax=Hevea brasiliensis TaxID=3981 RepID=A0A6A6NAQ7_HEVBR|nr:hypothetical protein GH714_029123 [Hevea brasiliensis]
MAAATLSVRPNRLAPGSPFSWPPVHLPTSAATTTQIKSSKNEPWRATIIPSSRRLLAAGGARAGSRADDSAPFEMSVENALKLLGVSESASFDDILRAKKAIIAACKDNQEAIAQVEAAYDMLLMRSLTQRRAGKVANSGIWYADVKPINGPGLGSVPQWLRTTMKNTPISVETIDW